MRGRARRRTERDAGFASADGQASLRFGVLYFVAFFEVRLCEGVLVLSANGMLETSPGRAARKWPLAWMDRVHS